MFLLRMELKYRDHKSSCIKRNGIQFAYNVKRTETNIVPAIDNWDYHLRKWANYGLMENVLQSENGDLVVFLCISIWSKAFGVKWTPDGLVSMHSFNVNIILLRATCENCGEKRVKNDLRKKNEYILT